MKKNLLIFFVISIQFFSIPCYSFVENNEILMTIKEIKVLKSENENSNYRLPLNEFYISKENKVFNVTYVGQIEKNRKENGIFEKKESIKLVSDSIKNEFEQVYKEINTINLEEINLNIRESPSKESKLLFKYSNSEPDITFQIGDMEKTSKNVKIKIKFDSLYFVEIYNNSKEVSFIVGDTPDAYDAEEIKKLIVFINKFIKEMD
ncbi:hypothetical protein [Fusobacterium sp. PH5-44]|uniref:hypothetical protein n=1 Tax=unclassified Fusobacterium TaxID=2648384 RepID=UPI003D254419